MSHLIVDGAVVSADRLSETKAYVKGKEVGSWFGGEARRFGGGIRACTAWNGIVLCAVPGAWRRARGDL